MLDISLIEQKLHLKINPQSIKNYFNQIFIVKKFML